MRPEQLDSGSTHTAQPQEGCALLHPLQGVSLLSTPLQGGILKPPALRVVVDWKVHITDSLDFIRFTPVTIIVAPDLYSITEFAPIETNWIQTTNVAPIT